MALQGAFLALTLVLPLWLHDDPARAAVDLRQDWWQMSGFPFLMTGVLVALPLLALQAPREPSRKVLRAGSTAYVLAVLGQVSMLVLLSQEMRLVALTGAGAWLPGLGAFGSWLLTLSLILMARRQTNMARLAAGDGPSSA